MPRHRNSTKSNTLRSSATRHYHKGWTAVTKHRTPWEVGAIQTIPFDDDIWEPVRHQHGLDAGPRFGQEMPDRLHALQRLWLIEAVKYNVVPLDDRSLSVLTRMSPDAHSWCAATGSCCLGG